MLKLQYKGMELLVHHGTCC